jgi:hypothetical protein
LLLSGGSTLAAGLDTSQLAALTAERRAPLGADWLVTDVDRKAGLFRGQTTNELVLDNGLIRRTFRLAPNAATVGFDNLMTGASVIRAVKPEALLSIDGKEYAIGGLAGQPEHGYLLPEWIEQMTADPAAFRCVGFEVGQTQPTMPWKRPRHAEDRPWPAPGVSLTLRFEAPDEALRGVSVSVHYELYDGMPLLCKWLTVTNGSGRTITLDRFTSELLATVEADSAVDVRQPRDWRLPNLSLLSDYSFFGMDFVTSTRAIEWLADPTYTSQVNYELKSPAMVVSRSPVGPDQRLAPGERFESFRTYVLVHDTDERERQGLAVRRLHRALSPWVTENPLMMHVRSADTKTFRNAVDQCAEVGFEMIIYTFGSGLNMESEDPAYLARIKADVDYAHAKGIEVGAYSLLASRSVSPDVDVINPATGKTGGAIFGNSPCLASDWGEDYFRKIKNFIEVTGLDLLEHDGSYPGDVCASIKHSGHRGLADSQWVQWRIITDFYKWCRARGVFLNVPDYYMLAGSNKTGMGYRESNWSLPRERQIILGRQNIFDGTWTKTPTMGWMFVPLTEYHGGGAAATLEPLSEHLDAYEAHLANNLGAGVQACYRGPRLYDTDATKALVKQWVSWFKAHRDILESDIIHVRRADGRDIDCLLHVNPRLKRKGMAVIYNPLGVEAKRTLRLPLYSTGLTRFAVIRERDGKPRKYVLDREYNVEVPVKVPAKSMTWLVIE